MAIGESGNATPAERVSRGRGYFEVTDPTKKPFFWLSAFFLVYCARPEDWVPGLKYAPLAKITAILAIWGLFKSFGRTKRTFKDLPKEAWLLLTMIVLLFMGGFLSPVWKGGAVSKTIDFSKIWIAWVMVFLLITSFGRLRRIIFIQASSVVVACVAALAKGRGVDRLAGVLGGIYSNPNDLAFAIVLALPFALAFMVTAKSALVKTVWLGGMLVMLLTIFVTASRAGFINLVISGTVTLYYFAIKGKRPYLIVTAALAAVLIMFTAGGKLYDRFQALSGATTTEQSAYGSYEERKFLMYRAVDAIRSVSHFWHRSGRLSDIFGCVARRSYDVPSGGRGRGHSGSHYLPAVFPKSVSEPEDPAEADRSRYRSHPVRGSAYQFAGGVYCGRAVCPGGLPVFPVFCGGFHGNFIADNQRTRSRPGIGASTAAETGPSFSGGLCRSRKNRRSHSCPLNYRQYCVA